MTEKQRIKRECKAEATKALHSLFRDIWDEREDTEGCCYCYETGKQLPGWKHRSSTLVYDHVLPKSKYPQYAMNKQNIIILDPAVHTQKTHNIDKTPRVKELYEQLLALHEENKLEEFEWKKS